MCTVPWRSSSAARQASWSERVKTDAVRPYSVPLAISSASSSVEKEMIGATGPKVSSCAIRIALVTPSTIVGS
jgi:hypothetical protein